jgi:Helix-turn-helix domain
MHSPRIRGREPVSEEASVEQPSGDNIRELDPQLVRALEHPIRVQFLRLLADRPTLSPAEAQQLIGEKAAPGSLAYHARVLADLGLIEPAGDPDPARGLSFRVTPTGEEALATLGIPPK